MKKIYHPFLVFLSSLYQLVRELQWSIVKTFKSKVKLFIYPNVKADFVSSGFIVKELYKYQHLVNLSKSWEFKTLKKIDELISKTEIVVLDVGANIGLHSLFISKIVKEGSKIFAFEPCSSTFDILTSNISLNKVEKIVFPQKIALTNYTGVGFIQDSTEIQSMGDVFNQVVAESKSDDKETVDAFTLDDWMQKNSIDKIDLIKVDIEGGEFNFLLGAQESIAKYKPLIIFEVVENFLEGSDHGITDIFKFLFNLNYSVTQIDGHNWLAFANDK